MTYERAPVQMSPKLHKPPGTVSWAEHVQTWEAYAKRHGYQQSAERIAERGGFSYCELVMFLGHDPSTWEPLQKPLTWIEKAALS